MKKKTKELVKDISFMIWGFVGSCTIGSLFILSGLGHLTGSVVKIVDGIGKGLFASSILIIIFIILFFKRNE